MMPRVPKRRTHDYLRHGITSLFAALDVASGQIYGSIHRHHRAVIQALQEQGPSRPGRNVSRETVAVDLSRTAGILARSRAIAAQTLREVADRVDRLVE